MHAPARSAHRALAPVCSRASRSLVHCARHRQRRFASHASGHGTTAPHAPPLSDASTGSLGAFGGLTNELDRIAPRFEIDGDDIDVLKEPAEFYRLLKAKIASAKHRIYISTLYIGKTEHELIQTLHTALTTNPSLKLTILTDYLRGTRESPQTSCASLLAPLTHAFPDRVTIRMFHTPNLAGVKKAVLPSRINEGWGLQHMKLYGVDDELILSGANLSSDYFTNRQDRYFLFRSRALTEFFERAHNAVCDISFDVKYSSEEKGYAIKWTGEGGCPNPLHDRPGYVAHASALLAPLLKPQTASPTPSSNSSRARTILYPLFQFAPLLPPPSQTPTAAPASTELPALRLLLARLSTAPFAPARWTFTAGYFNMTPAVRDLLLSSLQTQANSSPEPQGTVLTAHPAANGFFNSPGISGLLPPAYTHLAKGFWGHALRLGLGSRLALHEWRRGTVGTQGGWSYHAKGLWVWLPPSSSSKSEDGGDGPAVTLVGSSNYTKRSHELDLEANALILTTDPRLRARLADEEAHLREWAGERVGVETFQAEERRVSWRVKVALWIVGVVGGAL